MTRHLTARSTIFCCRACAGVRVPTVRVLSRRQAATDHNPPTMPASGSVPSARDVIIRAPSSTRRPLGIGGTLTGRRWDRGYVLAALVVIGLFLASQVARHGGFVGASATGTGLLGRLTALMPSSSHTSWRVR